jgi:hypothetical protein
MDVDPKFQQLTMNAWRPGTVNLTCDGRRSSNFHLVCDAVLAQSWRHYARGRTKIAGIRSGWG